MAVTTKIDSIERDVQLIVADMLSPAAQSKAIADYAREEISKGDDANRRILGRLPPRTVTVDGNAGAALETVRPSGGNITAEWELFVELLGWFAQTLDDRSPFVSGEYKNGHTLFADGVEVPRGAQIPLASEFVYINLVAYARKIEVGRTQSGRPFVIQVQNRIYERTFKDGKARFGNQARITFGYETQTGAYRLKQDQAHRGFGPRGLRIRKKQSSDRVAGTAVSVPAIRISLKDR